MKRPLVWMGALVLAIGFLFAEVNSACAQGFNIGGFNQQSNRDDDDENRGDGSNQGSNQGGRRARSSRNSSNNSGNNVDQQIQQFFGGGQNNQNQNNPSQGGSNSSRQSNQQGVPKNQQFGNWNNSNQNNINFGGWNAGKWQGSRKVDNWTKHFGGNEQPFSSQWYQDHPKAWKYDNQNKNANIWVGGTLPGLYGWLGWGNVPQQYRVYYGNNVSQFDRAHYGQWYPLGVFSLMAGPGDSGTRMVQLAVDQHGHIAGNYYDMITGSNYSVSGDISRQSQRASFSLNKNQFVRFRAPIYELLQPYGRLTVRLPGGDQQWQFVRLEN